MVKKTKSVEKRANIAGRQSYQNYIELCSQVANGLQMELYHALEMNNFLLAQNEMRKNLKEIEKNYEQKTGKSMTSRLEFRESQIHEVKEQYKVIQQGGKNQGVKLKTAEYRELRQKDPLSSEQVSKKHPSSETKNVIKTVVISVCNYIAENQEKTSAVLESKNIKGELPKFIHFVGKIKKDVNYLKDFRRIMAMKGKKVKYPQFRECLRIMAYEFLRKRSLSHIMNSSRIVHQNVYLKCRMSLLQGMKRPTQMNRLKDY